MKIKTGVTLWLVLVIGIVISVGFTMSYVVSDYFKQTILKRDVDVNAKFISVQAKQHLTPEDFVANDFGKKDVTYSKFFQEIDTDEIVRFKVWSTGETVVYSDEKDIVGKTFSDNDELEKALDGNVVSEISDLKKSESTSEKKFNELIEIYVPVKSDSGKVLGVIETYASLDLANQYIENANYIIFFVTSVGVSITGAVILLTFSTFRKNLINPIIEIHKQTKRIQEGDLDIKSESIGYEEVRKLGNEVEIMTSKLKEQQGQIAKTERLSAIGELAARLAHDLRNPLSVIRNSLLLIRHKYGSNPETIKDFDRIDRSIFRMSHQLENVMDFVTTRELQMDTKSVSSILRNAIEKAGIPESIKINLPPNDAIIDCDSEKLEVVFENILVNAKHAMKDSGIITTRINEDGDWIRIEIEDSGSGIPKDILPKIFEPLFTTKQEGTGLGLSSCKNIIEQHKGTIEVRTDVGKGTTFIIKLPVKKLQK